MKHEKPYTFSNQGWRATVRLDDGGPWLELADEDGRFTVRSPLASVEVCDRRMPRVETVPALEVVDVTPVEHGLHLTLVNRTYAVGIGLWLRLVDGELRVILPPAELREEFDDLFRVYAVNLLPELMGCGPDGQLLLPLGQGAVVRPADKPALVDRFMIYGEQERWELNPQLPVCAAGGPAGGMTCLAVQGAADMRCEVRTRGDGHGRVAMAATFREHWIDKLDHQPREWVYTPVPAGTDLLHAAAKRLRRHVLEDLRKPTLEQRAAESPEVAYVLKAYIHKLFFGVQRMGAMVADRRRASIDESLFALCMTFAEAEAGLGQLKQAGVDQVYTQSVGWNLRGHDGAWPSRFPVEERLGGEAGFRRLIEAGKALGYHMAVHDNWECAVASSQDYHEDRVIHGLDGRPRITGYWGGGIKSTHWGLAEPEQDIRAVYARIRALGLNGMHYLDGIGAPLMRNYHPQNGGFRALCAAGKARSIRLARETFGACASETGYLYTVLESDLIAHAGDAWLVSRYPGEWVIARMQLEPVPLWHLALHGLVACESHGEQWAATMRCIALGLVPRAEWSTRPGVMPVLDDGLISRIKAKYHVFTEQGVGLVAQPLERWSREGDVETTQFADGTEVIADYQHNALVVNGTRVARPKALAE